ncbi:MAG: GNAT family N-acetyltransferase [Zoogloea sp.]|nr:GNAT family N-acetyltransferase [Zoogloea sp.]
MIDQTTVTHSFRPATSADVAELVRLVNSAYRGDSSRRGWTTEADLLDGQRTDADEVGGLIAAADSLILLCVADAVIVGCVHLLSTPEGVHLGMLVVRPGMQGAGLGKRLIAAAEAEAVARWDAEVMVLHVIDLRAELVAYYERRGYRRTGRFDPFPQDVRFGIPKVSGLRLEVLEKPLAAHAA